MIILKEYIPQQNTSNIRSQVNYKPYDIVQRLNKEKLKVLLQISGCKPSHSFQLSERIFEHIFSKLRGIINHEKKKAIKKNKLNKNPISSNSKQL